MITVLDLTPELSLRKEISFFQYFKNTLITRQGIDPSTPQEKLDGIMKELDLKISEYEVAIKRLATPTITKFAKPTITKLAKPTILNSHKIYTEAHRIISKLDTAIYELDVSTRNKLIIAIEKNFLKSISEDKVIVDFSDMFPIYQNLLEIVFELYSVIDSYGDFPLAKHAYENAGNDDDEEEIENNRDYILSKLR
ncbi:MAG: hypothetical protein PHT07_21595 [Paludibacter sp.]|nr:hypothetical protein [Paludibacter sp.]